MATGASIRRYFATVQSPNEQTGAQKSNAAEAINTLMHIAFVFCVVIFCTAQNRASSCANFSGGWKVHSPLVLLLRTIPAVILAAAQSPTLADYAVASCTANSRAGAVALCQQLTPAGGYRLVTPVTDQERSFARSAALVPCRSSNGYFVDAAYLRNGPANDPESVCQWSRGPATGQTFSCTMIPLTPGETPLGGPVYCSYFYDHDFFEMTSIAGTRTAPAVCQAIYCSETAVQCSSGARTESIGRNIPNCCVCSATHKAKGPTCACALQSGGGDCVTARTEDTLYSDTAGCRCQCRAGFTGSTCAHRLCTPRDDCGGDDRATGATGIFELGTCACTCAARYGPGGTDPRNCSLTRCQLAYDCVAGRATSIAPEYHPCRCACLEQYVGDRCETRICHVNHDCNGVGTAITGIYPDCHCTCPPRYGGRNCRTLSATPSRSVSTSSSPSLSLSATVSLTGSVSPSSTHSLTATQTGTSSDSGTATASISATPSLSASVSTTWTGTRSFTASASLSYSSSESTSNTLTRSASLSTSGTSTHTLSPSVASPSASATCRDYGDLSTDDTCEVLRPLPSSAAKALIRSLEPADDGLESLPAVAVGSWWIERRANVNASLRLYAPLQCADLSVPFDDWTGRTGAPHAIAVASVDSRIPLGSLQPPAVASPSGHVTTVSIALHLVPITVLFADAAERANVTLTAGSVLPPHIWLPTDGSAAGGGVNATGTFFTAVVALRYGGPPTLNKMRYGLSGARQWSRCPVAMPGTFTVTLESSQRLLPPIVADVASGGGALLSVGGALSGSTTMVLQLGVVQSLKEMSRCRGMALDGEEEDDNDNYEEYTEGVLNPLGLALGGSGGGRRYLRGALLTSAAYAVVLGSLLAAFSLACHYGAAWLASIGLSFGGDGVGPQEEPPLAGFPSALVAVAAFAMDGAIGAGTMLAAYGEGAGDVVAGAAGLLVSLLYTAHVLLATTRGLPRGLVAVPLSPRKEGVAPATHPSKGGGSAPPTSAAPNTVVSSSLPLGLDLLTPSHSHAASSDEANEYDDDPLGLFDPPRVPSMTPSGDEECPTATQRTEASASSPNKAPFKSQWARRAVAWATAPTHEWADQKEGAPLATVNEADTENEEMFDLTIRRWWAPTAPQAWLLRYRHYTEDSRVAWYCGAELLAAGLVTAMGSLAFEDVPFCVGRGVACCLVLSAQLGVLAMLRPQVHRWRWLVATAVAALQTASAALSTANAVVQEQHVELVMDVLGVAVFALMAASTAAEAAVIVPALIARLLEAVAALRRHFATHRCRPQPSPQDSAASLEQLMLQAGGEGTTADGDEGTEMGDVLGDGDEGIGFSAPNDINAQPADTPDAVRGLLRDFGQYLRERGEEAPAEWGRR